MLNRELMLRGEAAGQADGLRQFRKARADDLEKKLKGLCLEKKKADMKQIIRYSHMEELTQELVDTFIKKR